MCEGKTYNVIGVWRGCFVYFCGKLRGSSLMFLWEWEWEGFGLNNIFDGFVHVCVCVLGRVL